MSRKLKKGYFVRGEFIAEGSERDLELKRELKGTNIAITCTCRYTRNSSSCNN